MKGKKEELRIPMKFKDAVADFLKVKPPEGKKAKKASRKKAKSHEGDPRESPSKLSILPEADC